VADFQALDAGLFGVARLHRGDHQPRGVAQIAGFIQRRLPSAAVICTMRTGKLLPWLFVRSLRLCRHVVANSHVAKRVLTDDHDIVSHKITVIHNSVLRFTDETAARNNVLRRYHGANPTTAVLLNVAMFRPEKNQRELIEIVSGLPASLDWQLWLAGEGPERAACERLVAIVRGASL